MSAGLETEVEESFNADKFVKETLTLPPTLRGLTRNSMVVDGLVHQVKKGISYCSAQLGSKIGSEYLQYRSAVRQLTKKLEEDRKSVV